jgi:hypothetical protein
MNDKLLTKHQQRQRYLRTRLNRVVRHLDPPTGRGRGNTDGYTTFAMRASELATQNGKTISRARHELADGTPKDWPNALRRFGKGRSGLVTARLDLIEMTCDVLERELQDPPATEMPPVPPLVEPVPVDPEQPAGPQRASHERTGGDPELAAVAQVYAVLKTLDGSSARERVVSYAEARIAAEEGGF